jgi:hypothetical protein
LFVAGCGSGEESASETPTIATSSIDEPVAPVGAADGAIAQFEAPTEFWCMDGDPAQAQATLGWKVPEAKSVKVYLDGEKLHSGIRERLPFSVLAGDAAGIGTTVVFPCEGDEHDIEVRWRLDGDAPSPAQAVTISKAAGA